MIIDKKTREQAAGMMLQDILSLHPDGQSKDDDAASSLCGKQLAHLLERNFARIDCNNNGICRRELAEALSHPQHFSKDEYAMLKLISRYFDSIASLCDDQEEGETVVITRLDKDVLVQFLLHSSMTLEDLSNWLASNESSHDNHPPPPRAS